MDEAQQEVQKKETIGFIYFIETHDGTFIKIGYSRNVSNRFHEIGLLMPGLRLIGYMSGTLTTERSLHAVFSADRERGEWFRRSAVIDTFIANAHLSELPRQDRQRNPKAKTESHRDGGITWGNLPPRRRRQIASKAARARKTFGRGGGRPPCHDPADPACPRCHRRGIEQRSRARRAAADPYTIR